MKKVGKLIAWILALAILFSSMSVLAEDVAALTARVTGVDELGTIYLDITEADLANAGIKPLDIVEVAVGAKRSSCRWIKARETLCSAS